MENLPNAMESRLVRDLISMPNRAIPRAAMLKSKFPAKLHDRGVLEGLSNSSKDDQGT